MRINNINKDTSHWINQIEINRYLHDVRKFKILTRDEENELIVKIRMGCEKSKEKLIYTNLRFVISMVKQYQNQGLSLGDLINEGNIGLIKAAERFDYTQTEIKFISYAVWWIKQSILHSLHENSRLIRLPVNVINDMLKIRKEKPTEFEEITSANAQLSIPTMSYLDAPYDEDGGSMYDVIEDIDSVRPDIDYPDDKIILSDGLRVILKNLKATEAYVITKHFGLDGGDSLSLQDISEHLELTKERVRQIKEKAIRKLRFYSKEIFELL
jgi:RNA polymerase primary sigma factor